MVRITDKTFWREVSVSLWPGLNMNIDQIKKTVINHEWPHRSNRHSAQSLQIHSWQIHGLALQVKKQGLNVRVIVSCTITITIKHFDESDKVYLWPSRAPWSWSGLGQAEDSVLVLLDLTGLYPTDTHHLNLHINRYKHSGVWREWRSEAKRKENTEFVIHVPVAASACLSPADTLITGSFKD